VRVDAVLERAFWIREPAEPARAFTPMDGAMNRRGDVRAEIIRRKDGVRNANFMAVPLARVSFGVCPARAP